MNELKYGIYSGFTFSIYVLIEHVLGFNSDKLEIGMYTHAAAAAIPWFFIFFGIRNRKKNIQQNTLTLLQGVRSGMVIALISSVIISAFLMIYVRLINTGMSNAIIEFQRKKLEDMKLPADQIKMQLENLAKMYDGSIGSHLSLAAFFTSVGIVIALICSLILRSRKISIQ